MEATERLFKQLGIEVAQKPVDPLRPTFCNGKVDMDHHDRSGVIYAILYMKCGREYVGETR